MRGLKSCVNMCSPVIRDIAIAAAKTRSKELSLDVRSACSQRDAVNKIRRTEIAATTMLMALTPTVRLKSAYANPCKVGMSTAEP